MDDCLLTPAHSSVLDKKQKGKCAEEGEKKAGMTRIETASKKKKFAKRNIN